jgi:hypothetical protein
MRRRSKKIPDVNIAAALIGHEQRWLDEGDRE